MIIHVEKTGGFAGLKTAAKVDTGALPEAEARKFHDLVKAADFFSLPSEYESPRRGADYYLYILTVESEGRGHTVAAREDVMPPALKALAQAVLAHARGK